MMGKWIYNLDLVRGCFGSRGRVGSGQVTHQVVSTCGSGHLLYLVHQQTVTWWEVGCCVGGRLEVLIWG